MYILKHTLRLYILFFKFFLIIIYHIQYILSNIYQNYFFIDVF